MNTNESLGLEHTVHSDIFVAEIVKRYQKHLNLCFFGLAYIQYYLLEFFLLAL